MYDKWLANGVHQYTEAGNMKSSSTTNNCRMVGKELIIHSFQVCTLNHGHIKGKRMSKKKYQKNTLKLAI